MVRKATIVAGCALLLAGCGDRPAPPNNRIMADAGVLREAPPPAAAPAITVDAPTSTPAGQQFSYTHSWAVRMPHLAVSPRFQRARDLCLHDKTLSCKLVSASIALSDGTPGSYTFASLEVQLPHARLDGFEHALLAPIAGEKAGDAVMASRQTQAQSVETQVSDTARKVAQLTAYRDRLLAIEKRPNLSVDDLIKLEEQLSQVQTDLDGAASEQRTLSDGIAREDVNIQLTESYEPVGPIALAWRDAGVTLSDNAASALRFAIGSVPWLPVIAAGLLFVSWLWRLFQRRRKAKLPTA